MAVFGSTKIFSTQVTDISGVMDDVKGYFLGKGYEVSVENTTQGGFISLSKGGLFKTVLGMKTALNVEIRQMAGGLSVEAKVGIFQQQAIPTLIMLFVAWPVVLTQIGGLVQQAKLDDELMMVVENAINNRQNCAAPVGGNEFCVSCGASIAAGSAFCSACGAKQG